LYFRLYLSEELEKYNLNTARYAKFVTKIIKNYAALNPQYIDFEVRRVTPYSQMEQNALNDGILAVIVDDEPFYLGLAVRDEKGFGEAVPRLLPERRFALEDDINHILYRQQNRDKPLIAIVSPNLPLFGEPVKGKVWSIMSRLAADYRVGELSENSLVIPEDVDLLIVQDPSYLPELFLYALDQYLMRGGKVIMLPDPYSEAEHFYRGYPPTGKNNIAALLKSYGLIYDGTLTVGDLNRAVKAEISENGISRMQAYPLWFFAKNDEFSYLHFRTPGAIQIEAVEEVDYKPLVLSSGQAGTFPVSMLRYLPRAKIINRFVPQSEQYMLAVLAEGNFSSHFREEALGDTIYKEHQQPFLPWAVKKAKLAVIADSDFISDDAWVYAEDRKNPLYGTVSYASNADFFLNLINQMLGERSLLNYSDAKNVNAQTITDSLFAKSAKQYASAIEAAAVSAAAASARAEELPQDNLDDYGKNLQYLQQADEAQTQVKNAVADINRYNYLIKEQSLAELNLFMILNIAVYPLLIALLLGGLAWIWRGYKNRRIQK